MLGRADGIILRPVAIFTLCSQAFGTNREGALLEVGDSQPLSLTRFFGRKTTQTRDHQQIRSVFLSVLLPGVAAGSSQSRKRGGLGLPPPSPKFKYLMDEVPALSPTM